MPCRPLIIPALPRFIALCSRLSCRLLCIISYGACTPTPLPPHVSPECPAFSFFFGFWFFIVFMAVPYVHLVVRMTVSLVLGRFCQLVAKMHQGKKMRARQNLPCYLQVCTQIPMKSVLASDFDKVQVCRRGVGRG